MVHHFDLSAINALSQEILDLSNKLQLADLEKKIPEYTRAVRQQYSALDNIELSNTDIQDLENLIVQHKCLVESLIQKKKMISDELKQIRLGKRMKQAYPGRI